ncbi:MAG TPA: serine hydrolase domain-containing protein [Pyrinomonadaceae bacterium]|nr:serine hydrolase domain-containing protein [Pyrinomonadaceae bacterium]
MKNNQKIISFFLLLFFCATVSGKEDEVDSYIQTEMRNLHIPAVSLAVVRNGQIVKAKGYGLANIEANSAATSKTVYEIGSMTKQFTAAAVMMLVEEDKVSLDDKITKYFPGAPDWWNQITVRHLLNHTSGIQNHVAVPDYLDLFKTSITGKNFPSREEILKEFYKLPSEFAPGETWSYDNTGYYLLGIIIEKASGKEFFQFLNERIFKQLGMNETRSTDSRPVVPNRASGYEWVNGAYENRPILAPFVPFSAGCILSTVEDLAKWDAALYGEKLLKKSSLEQMWTPAKTINGAMPSFDHGFGWFIENYRGQRDIHHSGGTLGFSSVIHRFVDDKLTIIILTNHADRIIDQMAINIAGIYVPALRRPQEKTDSDPHITKRLREVMSGLLNGRHDPALFTPAMRIHLETATGKSWFKWYAYQGDLKDFTFSDREENGDYDTFRYKVILGNNSFWFSFKVMKDGRIAQIYWW